MKVNFTSVTMVYLSPPYDIENLPYRRFSDCVSMALLSIREYNKTTEMTHSAVIDLLSHGA